MQTLDLDKSKSEGLKPFNEAYAKIMGQLSPTFNNKTSKKLNLKERALSPTSASSSMAFNTTGYT